MFLGRCSCTLPTVSILAWFFVTSATTVDLQTWNALDHELSRWTVCSISSTKLTHAESLHEGRNRKEIKTSSDGHTSLRLFDVIVAASCGRHGMMWIIMTGMIWRCPLKISKALLLLPRNSLGRSQILATRIRKSENFLISNYDIYLESCRMCLGYY